MMSAADAALLAVLKERNARMHTEASIRHGRSFAPRSTDVFVATYPKCGTTWVTAMVHALRSGPTTFEEISEVAPWDVVASDCGQNLNDEQEGSFRVYKTHEPWETIAKGGKYVYVVRRPEDALLSFYNFLPTYCHVDGLSVEAFAEGIFDGLSHSGGLWRHFSGWLAEADASDRVLVLSYEGLKANPLREIDRLSRFVLPALDEPDRAALVDRALSLSTLDYMSSRPTQFDDHFQFDKLKLQMGLPADARQRATKVQRNGGSPGKGKQLLPASVRKILDDNWAASDLTRKLNCPTYDDLLHLVASLQRQRHPSPLDDDDDDDDVKAEE